MERRKLPDERHGLTHRFRIDGVKGFITVSYFEDGTVGEIFLKMDKQGTTVSGFCDAFAITASMLLQTGTPLSVIVEKFKWTSFPPSGLTTNPEIKIVTSPLDYVAKWLEKTYLEVK